MLFDLSHVVLNSDILGLYLLSGVMDKLLDKHFSVTDLADFATGSRFLVRYWNTWPAFLSEFPSLSQTVPTIRDATEIAM